MPIAIDEGMAGSNRINNLLCSLPKSHVSITNLSFESPKIKILNYNGNQRVYFLRSIFLKEPQLLFSLIKEIRKLHNPNYKNLILFYDAIHRPSLLLLILYARFVLKYTVIFDVVEDYWKKKRNLSIRGNLRLIFSGFTQRILHLLGDGAICISKNLFGAIQGQMQKKPVIHIPVSFSPELLNSERKTDAEDNVIRIFYGGTFGEKDGIEYLIEGFSMARAQDQDLLLILSGKPSKIDNKRLNSLIEKCPFKESINYLGYLDYKEYIKQILNANILCMTRNNSEFANTGFPFKLGEYLATGNPTIVSRLNEIKEYLTDQDCIFVDPESSLEISNAILKLRDPKLRQLIGANGKKAANANFNPVTISSKFESFIASIN